MWGLGAGTLVDIGSAGVQGGGSDKPAIRLSVATGLFRAAAHAGAVVWAIPGHVEPKSGGGRLDSETGPTSDLSGPEVGGVCRDRTPAMSDVSRIAKG